MQIPAKHLQNPTPLAHSSVFSGSPLVPFSSKHWSVDDNEEVVTGDSGTNVLSLKSIWHFASGRLSFVGFGFHLSDDLVSIAAGQCLSRPSRCYPGCAFRREKEQAVGT